MLRERLILGLRVGVTAAAAVTGVLLGLGRAHGAAFRPLNAAAHVFIGSRALYFERFNFPVTLLGLLLLVVALLVWGTLFALVAGRARGTRLFLIATGFALLIYIVNTGLLPARIRPGFELTLSAAELAAVYVALALALAGALVLSRDIDAGP